MLLLLAVCIHIIVPQQTAVAQSDIRINRITHPQLVKRNITAITQDNSGYIWLGTSSGLLRFDGVSVVRYRLSSETNRLDVNNPITSILSTDDGDIYFTLTHGGLAYLKKNSETIEFIVPDGVDPIDFVHLDFSQVVMGGDGKLLIASYSTSSVYIYDIESRTFNRIGLADRPELTTSAVIFIKLLSNGEIWVGTDLNGIFVYDKSFNFIRHHNSEVGNPNTLYFNSIRYIAEDAANRVWVATYSGGINIYDPETDRFFRPSSLYDNNSGMFGNTYDVHIDRLNRAWIATDDGLLVMDAESLEVLQHHTFQTGNVQSLVNNQVRTLFEDRNGTIWVGNENGGVHLANRVTDFIHAAPDPDGSLGMPNQIVRAILQTDDNTLWVGNQGGGISVLDLRTLRPKGVIRHDPRNQNTISSNGVSHLFKDGDVIWIGTWGGGLNKYHTRTNRYTRYRHDPQNPNSISDDRIQFVYKDRQGLLWVGTEGGLNLFDEETERFIRYVHNPEDINSISNNSLQTRAFVQDANNDHVFWIGTWFGLNKYDRVNNTFTRYLAEYQTNSTLSGNQVISLHDDGNGSLWIGTFNGGLNRMNKETGEIELYLSSDGLPSNVVFGILEDNFKNLWLSTNNGLSRFNIESNTFRNYAETDGIIGTDFWWGSGTYLDNGYLAFGSTTGFTMFNPETIQERVSDIPIVINSVRVHDTLIPFGEDGVIHLAYDQNNITIDFAALDFRRPEQIQYAYMLEGMEQQWNYSGNISTVNYTNLDGGSYILKIKATDTEGQWMDQVVELRIIVRSPFWETTLFYFLVIIVGALLVFGVIFLRTRQVEIQKQVLENLVNERTRELAAKQLELENRNEELRQHTQWLTAQKTEIENQQDLILQKSQELTVTNDELIRLNEEKNSLIGIVAHDLRSPLASITSLIEIIKLDPEMSEKEIRSMLQTMEGFVSKQLKLVTRILDTEALDSGNIQLKPEFIEMKKWTANFADSQKNLAKQKNIKIRTVLTRDALYVYQDPSHLEQVYDNLVSNAIKFSPYDSSIVLILEEGTGTVRLGVRDHGPGITSEDQKRLFHKFQKLSAKPTGGETSTGLGLSIVKRFVDAMGGHVWVESVPGEGATFWVDFPAKEYG